MPSAPSQGVTELLFEWREGNREAFDQLVPLIYNELRRLASGYLRRESSGHTLQTTALVHEAYLRLIDQYRPNYKSINALHGHLRTLFRRGRNGYLPPQFRRFTSIFNDRLRSKERFIGVRTDDKEDVYPALKEFFGKRGVEA